jgi:hypothetical protein
MWRELRAGKKNARLLVSICGRIGRRGTVGGRGVGRGGSGRRDGGQLLLVVDKAVAGAV